MERAGDVLEKHTIVVLNEVLKQGFTQLPRYVLRDSKLSFGARLTYAVLLSYAWQDDSCFPGQERMAKDLGTTDRSIRRFLQELKEQGYIDWKQQGLNKPNIYYILDYKPLKSQAVRTLGHRSAVRFQFVMESGMESGGALKVTIPPRFRFHPRFSTLDRR